MFDLNSSGSGTAFKAHPCCSLGPGCPVGAAFLGQVVMDRMQRTTTSSLQQDSILDWRINVLVFDILSFGHDRNFVQDPEPVAARYALLRDLEDDFSKVGTGIGYCMQSPDLFAHCWFMFIWGQGVFVSQSMKVQWAGKLEALRKFKQAEGPKLPHIIDCFVRLGRQSPLRGVGMVVAEAEDSDAC